MTADEILQSFRDQAVHCDRLGSALTARILLGLADQLRPHDQVSDTVLGWPGDARSSADALGLRLVGGLHALVQSGKDAALAALYQAPPVDDAVLMDGVLAAMARHPAFLIDWLESPPQTNEVRRSAVMIAAAHWLTARLGLPMVVSELGSSAGVNLIWDQYALTVDSTTLGPPKPALTLTPEWRGNAPTSCLPHVAIRAGVDRNPLDPVADRLRLMSLHLAGSTRPSDPHRTGA